MGTPRVIIEQTGGNLGRVAPSEDGISAMVVSGPAVVGKFTQGTVLGPFRSVQDAEALGITNAYDTTNKVLAHKHISDFYTGAGNGTELYVMVVAPTVTMEDICDKDMNYLAKMLRDLAGKVRIAIVTRVPDEDYTPSYTDQLDDDIIAAITNLKALRTFEFDRFRPVSFVVEGRDWQGNASTAKDLRASLGLNANRVMLPIINDADYAQLLPEYNHYASAGLVGGIAAGKPVNRSIGRVKDGAIAITNAGFSNGAKFETVNDLNRDTLHDKGYVIPVTIVGRAGFFLNGDAVCTPVTDDYNSFARGRVADKASRIARIVFSEDLNDDIPVDPSTGFLPVSVIKNFQESVKTEINAQMVGEISAVEAVVSPNQNIIATGEILIELDIVPRGLIERIKVLQSFKIKIG